MRAGRQLLHNYMQRHTNRLITILHKAVSSEVKPCSQHTNCSVNSPIGKHVFIELEFIIQTVRLL